jgi:hypothetical protein
MDLTNATLVVLASMIFVLSGMMGYLFWQQNRLLQHVQSLALIVSNHLTPPQAAPIDNEEVVKEELVEPEPEVEVEDDRASVENDEDVVETVEGPPPAKTEAEKTDIDDLQDKTAAQLRDLLTQKGIPFGKRDAKTVLIQLLKASS